MLTCEKDNLRKHLQQTRKAQDLVSLEQKSNVIQEILLSENIWQTSLNIGLYAPIQGEVRTNILIDSALKNNKNLLLPRCGSEQGHMDFYICKSLADLEFGSFNILEPRLDICKKQNEMDLLIVPALAFDQKGYRLGFGGGYYDRFLQKNVNIPCIGLAFAWQMFETLPSETWDMPVNGIINEEGILWI